MAENKNRFFWELRVAAALVCASVLLFALHYACYRDLRHICFWTLTDLAFLPLSVLMTTVFINRLLAYRDKALRLDKRNMLSGVFFSDLGTRLLVRIAACDPAVDDLQRAFGNPDSWNGRLDERQVQALLRPHAFAAAPARGDLQELRVLLSRKTDFLIRMLENPNLLEHESFTNLLLAVLHLAEELAARSDLDSVPETDLRHLTHDTQRAYALLVREWVVHMAFLKRNYPYLFSLAVRTNPLDKSASPVVR